jgi:hypothetical protein
VTRGRLGIELYQGLALDPGVVTSLALSLPGLEFPLDLSGGVPLFRHRRGQLEHLSFELNLDALSRWLTVRLQEIVGVLERPVGLWVAPPLIGIGLTGKEG